MKRMLVIITTILAVSACTFSPPATPTDLTASEDLHNKIELTWAVSPNAGVYYVYRGAAAGLTGTDEEYLGSTAIQSYIDTTVETEVPYWYAVSAADPFGNNETALSTEASGVAPDLIWGLPATVAESATAAVLAEGGTSPIIVTATAGSPIIWYEYDEETGWTPAAESPGTTDTPGIITTAVIGGALHVAFTDAASSPGGKVTVRRYSDDQWETLGTPYAPVGAVGPLSLASSGGFINPEVYLGYLDDSVVVTKYYSTTAGSWADLGTPSVSDASTLRMVTFDGNPYLFYEETTSPSLTGKVFEEPGGWTALPPAYDDNITDGFLITEAGTDSIYLAYSASADTLSVKEYSAGAWSDLASISSVDTSGPVDQAVLNGTLYAAYVTATETVVSRYVDEAWEVTAVNPDDTPAAADGLDLEVHGGSLRLLTVTGGKAEVRVFE